MAYGITIRNLRTENLDGGWAIYINTARTIRDITIDNVMAGAMEAWKGVYIRGAQYVSFLNYHYSGTSDQIGVNNAIASTSTTPRASRSTTRSGTSAASGTWARCGGCSRSTRATRASTTSSRPSTGRRPTTPAPRPGR
jgi:hypothetical protein